jgi:hypothetical protein
MTQSEEISHDVHRFATERGVFYGSDPATAPRMLRQRRLPQRGISLVGS